MKRTLELEDNVSLVYPLIGKPRVAISRTLTTRGVPPEEIKETALFALADMAMGFAGAIVAKSGGDEDSTPDVAKDLLIALLARPRVFEQVIEKE